ncbi:glycosyltransferase involved in cell wall biosynthesis [Okibacterium sp. HSC-33S16]|uniref:glycosyltransferase n=1 Tax=Okibacterium sp. HSC-33S16 TaxID=2910965 RepID=UPI0020A1CC18|nr:glycosyltransferase [Okibacterium sp. HSC-33S16]MCP2032150.1 glycosyltransferase involved in cell wall biosynthesis [Okibacterium sp. HSC-33S16]
MKDYASDVVVTPHPPFSFAAEATPSVVPPTDVQPKQVTMVGGLRPDKGSIDLPAIARASGGGWTLLIAGPDVLTVEVAEAVRDAGVNIKYATDSMPPTDDELRAAMKGSRVMLAPYRLVTESGSVLLALSLEVPVLGYFSTALSRVVAESALAESPEELGQKLKRFLKEPWETFRLSPAQLALESRQGWEAALARR